MKYGSKKFSVAASDAAATVRDASLVLISSMITGIGLKFTEGGFSSEIQGALVIVTFAAVKLIWKTVTDTRRASSL